MGLKHIFNVCINMSIQCWRKKLFTLESFDTDSSTLMCQRQLKRKQTRLQTKTKTEAYNPDIRIAQNDDNNVFITCFRKFWVEGISIILFVAFIVVINPMFRPIHYSTIFRWIRQHPLFFFLRLFIFKSGAFEFNGITWLGRVCLFLWKM